MAQAKHSQKHAQVRLTGRAFVKANDKLQQRRLVVFSKHTAPIHAALAVLPTPSQRMSQCCCQCRLVSHEM